VVIWEADTNASANVTTADLIGTVLYMIVFWAVLSIPPYKMYTFFKVSFCAVVITIVAMFIWAMAANHGAGDLVSPTKKISPA
jgi:cytosine/uracil/thiamine/allantoin permease